MDTTDNGALSRVGQEADPTNETRAGLEDVLFEVKRVIV